jgi:regulator of PEP synthase PpsR (kinase-PPPase family)
LYLALQYGVKAANYPITEEDLPDQQLPKALRPHKQKVFGLTIEPERLATIRNERKPNSRYASLSQCMHEIEEIELIYRRERVPFLNTTAYSVEEISTRIMVAAGLKRNR